MFFGDLTLRLRLRARLLSGPFGGHATLANNLISYWKLDETSGVRYDSVTTSANDLTDNNTVGSAAGMRNNAASFVAANSEYLSHATPSAIVGDGTVDWTFAAWINGGSDFNDEHIINCGSADEGPAVFLFQAGVGDHKLYVWGPSAPFVSVGDLRDIWVLVFGEFVAATATFRAQAVGTASNSGVWTTGVVVPTPNPAFFNLGRSPTYGRYFGGFMDEVAIWSRVLTAGERTALYNAGAGLFY